MPKKEKQAGRKNARKIGDSVEIKGQNYWEQEGYLAIRVPNPRRRFGAKFQQKGKFAKWDLIIVKEADVVQYKRRKKGMSKIDMILLKDSFKNFPNTKLIAILGWLDNGIQHESL